ncbi:MAG: hypothetical protein JW832_12425 [Deltaproteobacteria bacterium]|nr:hypothetical protein [Deltaproteobacteria bacterium]
MVKKICTIVMVCGFMFAAFAATADAAQPPVQQRIMKSIAGLKQQIAAADEGRGALNGITVQFLDDLAAVGDDRSSLDSLVMNYVADVQDVLAVDNTTKCNRSFYISVSVSAYGMLTELTSGNSFPCIVINLTNKTADIMSAQIKRDICLIDTAGGSGDRDALVQQLKGVETTDFVTNALDVFICNPEPSTGDYIGLFFNFLGINREP